MANSGTSDREPLYSWCIAFSCFCLSFLTVGLHRSAGIIYVSVIQVFGISREQGIWPFSLCGSIMCLLGPLAGFLTHYFSIRSILVSGVVISSAAIAACFFTPNLLYLVLFFGAIRGIGNGLVVTLNPVLINQHFKTRKATATGIAYAGASVGSFALPPLIDYLLAKYGFNGCFLILAAIVLNGLIPAFLARDPPAPTPPSKLPPLTHLNGYTAKNQTTEDSELSANKFNGVTISPEVSEPLISHQETQNGKPLLKQEVIMMPNPNGSTLNEPLVWYNNRLNAKVMNSDNSAGSQVQCNGSHTKDYQLLPDGRSATNSEVSPVHTTSVGAGTISIIKKMQLTDEGVIGHFRHTAQILANPMYLVICATFGCNVVNFLSYLTVIVDFALDRGVGEADAVFLVSAFSVGDLFGAVVLGWVSDLRFLERKFSVAIAFAVMGGLLAALPACWTHVLMLTVSICMGMLNGCVMTNIPVIMREYIGLERLAVAVGLGHFLVGVGQLLFPMLIGYFRDNVGAYDHLFHTLGAMCFLCAVLWFFEPLLSRLKKQ